MVARLTRGAAVATVAAGVLAFGGVVPAVPAGAAGAPPGGGLQALPPARLLDTRPGTTTVDMTYVGTGAVGPGGTLDVKVTGRGGVPASGAAAVVLNVTATAPTATTYVTVWPAGGNRPNASTLNAGAGQTVANSIIVGVGANGSVSLYNDAGDTFLLVDVAGWFAAGSGFTPTNPARLLDTRPQTTTIDMTYAGVGALAGGGTLDVDVTGRGGVPASGAAAVAVNVTATAPTATSYVTVWPTGATRPNASNLNVTAEQTVANLVVVGVGDGGRVSLFNESGAVHLLVDVVGWFDAAGAYQPITPARVADFRSGGATVDGQFSGDVVLAPGESRPIQIAGRAGVPAAAVGAVVLNVTITEPTRPSFITVWPGGTARPNASNLNVATGQTVANAVVVKVGSNGEINVFNESGQSHLIIDLEGWFGTVAQQQRTLDTGTGPFAHSCAIGRDTNTWCWGDNASGQVGRSPSADTPSPVVVDGTFGSRGVATGKDHSCALVGATVRCWGANGSGQLGDGTTTSRSTAASVGGLAAPAAVSAGAQHTCALLGDGGVRCWGANASGQLGNGTTTASNTPVAVTGLSGVAAISAGNQHTCGALVDATVRCWGANGSGQLGNGTTTASNTPVAVTGLGDVLTIAAGPTRTCATLAIGYAFCWGNNSGRSLGNGSDAPSSAVPVPVYSLGDAVGAAVGSSSSCAALANGTFRCWGLNLNGQLGDGTLSPSGSPVVVTGP